MLTTSIKKAMYTNVSICPAASMFAPTIATLTIPSFKIAVAIPTDTPDTTSPLVFSLVEASNFVTKSSNSLSSRLYDFICSICSIFSCKSSKTALFFFTQRRLTFFCFFFDKNAIKRATGITQSVAIANFQLYMIIIMEMIAVDITVEYIWGTACEKMVSYSVMSFIIVSARSVKSLFPKYESGNFLSLLAISILEFALSLYTLV